VLDELAARWPQFGLLGEEMSAGEQEALMRDSERGLWILDPLDGTANFASGIPFFGVSVALLGEGRVQAGVVYDPVRKESFSALLGQGAWLNGEPLQVRGPAPALRGAMGMVDLKRLPGELIERFAIASPYRSQRSFGSVALDWCWLAAERVQVYLHGGQKLWDYAAGSLVLAEASGSGGLYEDYAGNRVQALTLQPRIAIAATSVGLFEEWNGWLQRAMGDGQLD
jgi:myo-inositol-1(or 4)-monophosphatase